MQQLLIHFFSRILQADKELLDSISVFNGSMYFEQNSILLIFTLPALHQFLSQTNEQEFICSYSHFRQQVYKSSLNSELGKLGAIVKIHQSKSSHDQTLYKLCMI